MKMIHWRRAMEMSGHTNREALQEWIRSWNRRHPDRPIFRRRSHVDADSLEEALRNPGALRCKAECKEGEAVRRSDGRPPRQSRGPSP